MTFNYYLAWLHFDSRGYMTSRLPDGHRVFEVLHTARDNQHPPALWVLIEAVVSAPTFTPPEGFQAAPMERPTEYRAPQPPTYPEPPRSGPPTSPPPWRGQPQRDDREPPTNIGQERTIYQELSEESRDAEYRGRTNYVPGIPMSPTGRN
jgi:hypothetical protein